MSNFHSRANYVARDEMIYSPLLNSTVAYFSSLNLGSSCLGSIDARCGKVAIAGGRKTNSEVPIKPDVHSRRFISPLRGESNQEQID